MKRIGSERQQAVSSRDYICPELQRANSAWSDLQEVLTSDTHTIFDSLQMGWIAYTAHGWPFGISREGASIWLRYGQQTTAN